MASEEEKQQIDRTFSVDPDELMFFSDFVSVLGTETEVVLSFYETRPGVVSSGSGKVDEANSVRRAVVVMTYGHTQRMFDILAQHVLKHGATEEAEK
jgi:Protein of unknown function (DUF3467)